MHSMADNSHWIQGKGPLMGVLNQVSLPEKRSVTQAIEEHYTKSSLLDCYFGTSLTAFSSSPYSHRLSRKRLMSEVANICDTVSVVENEMGRKNLLAVSPYLQLLPFSIKNIMKTLFKIMNKLIL